jgi:hypothetical protein
MRGELWFDQSQLSFFILSQSSRNFNIVCCFWIFNHATIVFCDSLKYDICLTLFGQKVELQSDSFVHSHFKAIIYGEQQQHETTTFQLKWKSNSLSLLHFNKLSSYILHTAMSGIVNDIYHEATLVEVWEKAKFSVFTFAY